MPGNRRLGAAVSAFRSDFQRGQRNGGGRLMSWPNAAVEYDSSNLYGATRSVRHPDAPRGPSGRRREREILEASSTDAAFRLAKSARSRRRLLGSFPIGFMRAGLRQASRAGSGRGNAVLHPGSSIRPAAPAATTTGEVPALRRSRHKTAR